MNNFVEQVHTVALNPGDTSVTFDGSLPAGNVIAVAAFFDESKFPGIVRASIKDATGYEVSKMQDIRNLRDREAGYLEGKKPLCMAGGSQVSITVQPDVAIVTASKIDFVFVYASQK